MGDPVPAAVVLIQLDLTQGDVSVLKSLKCLVLGRISSQVAQEPRLLQGLEVEISESDTDEISLRRALDWS